MNPNYSIAVARVKNGVKVVAVDFDHSKVLEDASKAKSTDHVDIYKGGVIVKTVDPKALKAQFEADAKRAEKLAALEEVEEPEAEEAPEEVETAPEEAPEAEAAEQAPAEETGEDPLG